MLPDPVQSFNVVPLIRPLSAHKTSDFINGRELFGATGGLQVI
jgi:hypothetical protein